MDDYVNEYYLVSVLSYAKYFEGMSCEQKNLLGCKTVRNLYANGDGKNKAEFDKFIANNIHAIYETSNFECSRLMLLMMKKQLDNQAVVSQLYKNSLASYKNILLSYKALAEELGISDSLDLAVMFSYLLWNGEFSVTGEHQYSFRDELLLPGMPFEVFKGSGICLNYSAFLRDFLVTNGIKAAALSCVLPKSAITEEYKPDIDRNVNLKATDMLYFWSALLKPMVQTYGNHSTTMISDTDKTYVFDPTKLYVFNCSDSKKINALTGSGTLDIKIPSSLMLDPYNDSDSILELLYGDELGNDLTRKQVTSSFEEVIELLNNNRDLINDVYNETYFDKKKIDEETNKYGSLSKSLKLMR